MRSHSIILVKLGGSLITEKSRAETARREAIARLAGEIAQAAAAIPEKIVLGHGSGSFGHVAAHRFGIASGVLVPEQLPGVCVTQERAAALHREVTGALAAAGALPFSIAPSSCVVAEAGRPVALAEEPLLLALEQGLLPVTYGDVVMDRTWGASICSTEKLFELMAGRLLERGLFVRRVLWLGETAGLYDASGRTVPRVTEKTAPRALKAIGTPAGTDVTGGMRLRLETALALARHGIPSLLADGLVPGLLERALRGEQVPGTEVV